MRKNLGVNSSSGFGLDLSAILSVDFAFYQQIEALSYQFGYSFCQKW
jgi:hypothetical protein